MKKTKTRALVLKLLLFVSLIIVLLHFDVRASNDAISKSLPIIVSEPIHISESIFEAKAEFEVASEDKATSISAPLPTPHPQRIKSDFSNVLFIGDSITIGFINAHNTPVDKERVYAKIGAHVFEGSNLLGGNSNLIIDRCNGSVDYIFVMFGANDYGYKMSAYKNWYKELVKSIKQMFPNAQIVLQSVLPMNSTAAEPNRDQQPQKLNSVVKAVAIEENIQYLDVSNSIPNLRQLLHTDGLHFKPELYPLWITVIENNQKQHLNNKSG